jgi:hypothetical protein
VHGTGSGLYDAGELRTDQGSHRQCGNSNRCRSDSVPHVDQPTPASSGTMTITSAELQAAANLTLDFSTATDTQLLTAVDAISPGAPLVDATTAENEIANTVDSALAGSYAGTYSGDDSGTWTIAIAADGSVLGTYSPSKGGTGNVSGALVSATTYTGTAGPSTWTGTLDTSKTPAVFSGSWTNPNATPNPVSGTFTGTKQ